MAIGVVQMHEEVTVRVLKLIVSGNHKHQQGPRNSVPFNFRYASLHDAKYASPHNTTLLQ